MALRLVQDQQFATVLQVRNRTTSQFLMSRRHKGRFDITAEVLQQKEKTEPKAASARCNAEAGCLFVERHSIRSPGQGALLAQGATTNKGHRCNVHLPARHGLAVGLPRPCRTAARRRGLHALLVPLSPHARQPLSNRSHCRSARRQQRSVFAFSHACSSPPALSTLPSRVLTQATYAGCVEVEYCPGACPQTASNFEQRFEESREALVDCLSYHAWLGDNAVNRLADCTTVL